MTSVIQVTLGNVLPRETPANVLPRDMPNVLPSRDAPCASPSRHAQERRSDRSIAEQFGLLPAQPRVAVLIPCLNEAAAIGKVVLDFQRALPEATVYVYDNNSTDQTIREARAAGATVRRERLQGKGHVVRRMFADIDADAYILVDGDDTYDVAAAPGMLEMLVELQLDMVIAARYGGGPTAYRPGHRLGNAVLSTLVAWAFGRGVSDLLSGYRVFSRRFVKSFPALSSGFETETEFTVHALALHMPMQEVRADYRARTAGSRSKLHTVMDGMRILRAIIQLIQQEKPMQVFSLMAAGLMAVGLALGVSVVFEFLATGLVPRLPTAVLSSGCMLLAFVSLASGLILDAVSRGRKEAKRLAYLMIPPLECPE